MNSNAIQRTITFITVVLLQVFIFSRLPLGTYLQPSIYVGFILLLPYGYSQVRALLWAFSLGLCIDLLSTDVIGINAAALVALAFVRPYILKLFSTKSEFEAHATPVPRTIGLQPFIGYASISLLLHQSLFFFLDSFGFYDIFHTLLRIVASTVCSVLFIVLLQALLPESRRPIS